MADGVTIPPTGTGSATPVVATDDAGAAGHVQIVKLAISTDGSATAIPAEATNGLDVDVTRVQGTVTVDGSGVTQPVSHGALTELAAAIDTEVQVDVVGALPAGTNAIGKLAANSGVDIGDVDVTSVVPGTAAASLGKAEDVAHSTGDTGVAMLAVRRDSAAVGSGTDGDYSTVNVDGSGRLWVNASGAAVPVTDNSGSLTVDNAGTFATQVDGAALTALQLIDDTVFADDAAFTVGTSKVTAIGNMADETSTDSVDEGDVGVPRMTLDRRSIVVPQPHSAGGLTIFRSLDLDETEEDVKTSAGTVYGWYIANTATATRFVKFYNATAANVTVGTTTPVLTFPIPGNSSDDVAANLLGGVGIKFDTAICVAATTGVADNDTGAPGANEVIVNIFYS